MNREREGLLLCLVSAAGFGAMPIFGRKAFAAGSSSRRCSRCASSSPRRCCGRWSRCRRRPLGSLRGARCSAALLGLFGYSVQAGLYFGSIQRIDVGLASLLLYTYPALVTVAAFALGRERPSRRKLAALALASGGVALVVGGGTGDIDLVGAAMAFGCAVFYTGFILASERVAATTPPLAFAASVATGARSASPSWRCSAAASTRARRASMWIALIASVSTVMPIVLFMAGLARVGPSTASIASTVEPLFTVALAWLVLGETLGPVQLVGGALVLSAVVLLQLRRQQRALATRGESPLARSSERQSSSSPPAASHAHVSAIVSRSGRGASPARAARSPDIP